MQNNVITAVGIDVSKGKSMVAIRRPGGEIVQMPFEVKHTVLGLKDLVKLLHKTGGEIRIVMEPPASIGAPSHGHYRRPDFL